MRNRKTERLYPNHFRHALFAFSLPWLIIPTIVWWTIFTINHADKIDQVGNAISKFLIKLIAK